MYQYSVEESAEDRILISEEPEWDMYALLKKFESVDWDLSPAATLKSQTLDLDDCDLDAVPAAVAEIEYYAFRGVWTTLNIYIIYSCYSTSILYYHLKGNDILVKWTMQKFPNNTSV